MQYTITVNQLAYQTHFPDLNLSHAAIVDWFSRFTHSKKVSRLEHKGKTYYWLKYDKANSELPILGLSHPDSMRRLVKALCTAQILEAHPDNQKGRSYFAFGDRYDLTHSTDDLVHPGTGSPERSYKNARGGRTKMHEEVVQKCTTDPYIHDHDSKDQKELGSETQDFSLSESKKLELPDQNLEILDLDKNQNSIPDQQELNDRNPEKKESSAKERKDAPPDFAPQLPENAPLIRGGALWDINYLNEIWAANKAPKWKTSSLMFFSSEIQWGLDQFLLKAGGDRAEAYRLIGISIAEMARDDFYGSRSRMIGEVIGLDASKPCKTYCGHWLGAAIDREEKALEKAQKPQSVERSALPLPTTSNNIFSAQIKELFNERCTEQ